MEEPLIELENTYDEERQHKGINVELMDIENVLSGLQDRTSQMM